jgi:YVTN family beta-propeller protein
LSLDTGSNPSHAIISGKNLYIANTDSNTVTVINTEDNTVIETIPVGQ